MTNHIFVVLYVLAIKNLNVFLWSYDKFSSVHCMPRRLWIYGPIILHVHAVYITFIPSRYMPCLYFCAFARFSKTKSELLLLLICDKFVILVKDAHELFEKKMVVYKKDINNFCKWCNLENGWNERDHEKYLFSVWSNNKTKQ